MATKLDRIIQNNYNQILQWIKENKSKTWMAQQLHCDRGCFREALKRNNIDYDGQQGNPDYNIQNKIFGNLLVIESVDKSQLTETQQRYRGVYWRCRCLKCGHYTIVKGTVLRAGATIGDGCERSKGELKIKNLLEENNIIYKREFTFKNCRIIKNPAKFDFAVFKNNNIQYLIEYDGKQHFEDTFNSWIDSKEELKKRQNSDKIKSMYCKNNNIPLIRIPYTQLNNLCIEDLLLETSSYIEK